MNQMNQSEILTSYNCKLAMNMSEMKLSDFIYDLSCITNKGSIFHGDWKI